jgi:hypothetical protein
MASPKAAPAPPSSAAEVFGRLALTSAKLATPLFLIGLIYFIRSLHGRPEGLFFQTQDAILLILTPMLIAALSLWALKMLPSMGVEHLLNRKAVWLTALAVVPIGLAGVWLVFENYVLSLDEFMANFDAEIFRSGHLMAKVPIEWLPYADALTPKFVLETKDHAFWASAYLPVNALLRAGGAILHIQPLVNPLLAGLAVVMTWAVGRQLWPGHPRRAAAAALLLATSSPFLVMSMTAYAMTAHLAFNMVWLWLFLKDRRDTDALAIVVGAAACGLHQVVFHPFFAGPFILELLIARRWSRAVMYIGAYAVIGIFWISYWVLIYRLVGAQPQTASAAGGSYFANQLAHFLANASADNFGLMAMNLARFVTWQNLLVLPLMVTGGVAAFRLGGPLRAMALGLIVVPALLTIVLPTQVHGWGYRYLHGMLGTGCLLAVLGWVELTGALSAEQRQRANRGLALASLVSLVVLVPLHAYQARSFSHPLARVYRTIASRPEDVVLVDNATVWFDQGSMTRNDPFLRNRPKVMLLALLDDAKLDALCRQGTVWVFDGHNPAFRDILTADLGLDEHVAQLRAHLRQTGCAA